MGKNILIFSDGTGFAGGYAPDETRSNVYKLFRATRVSPDTCIDPKLQIAFYDAGLGSRAKGEAIKIKWWRRVYNLLSRATGLGITQYIIDCYAEIIRVWQPGDRIYLFGFSRGAYTVRCVGGVLKYCGVPTAVRTSHGQARPLQRDLKSARRIAAEAVKRVYQHGSSMRGDPRREEREDRAARFRAKYCSGDGRISNTAPYFIGVWETVETLGAGTLALSLFAGLYEALCVAGALVGGLKTGIPPVVSFALFGLVAPMAAYAAACWRYGGWVSLARYRMAFYDTKLHYAVRYARHALSIDENRRRFSCVPWEEEPPRYASLPLAEGVPRVRQVWFAGNHADIGGGYPETESRLSDIALSWMVAEATSLPQPILIDPSVLKLYPDSGALQHDERKAFRAGWPTWMIDSLERVFG
ncbi:MAG TPA: DUF2235 domain-containing protein, partial [Hyphomicrobiaceae bacterium]|nr:DUF2235 domain-containing protein [Hyphomicrobiaceae bacterium]